MAESQKQGNLPALYDMTKQQAWLTCGAIGSSAILDIISRGNPGVMLVGGVVAAGIGYTSKEIAEMCIPGSKPDEVRAAVDTVVDLVSADDTVYVDQRAVSKLRRLLRRDLHDELLWKQAVLQAERIEVHTERNDEQPTPRTEEQQEVVSERVVEDGTPLIEWGDTREALAMPSVNPATFTFSQVLARGFRPSLERIYLGTRENGTDVIVPVEDLCHVALAGLTGNGKGTIMRLVMSQLCSIGVRVLLLNPHYAGYDQSGGEDWTPFERMNSNGEPFLQQPPLPCSKEETIEMYMQWMAKTLIPQRKELAQAYKPIGRPYFVVIDEWPDVVKERGKVVVEYLEKLLREGRKYGIYVVVASQDFQVKTIGVDGGGVRKCFKTAFYVGGDAATARALLGDATDIRENALGKGAVMLRCKSVPDAALIRVPYVDNEALYLLLGPTLLDPSVFQLSLRKIEEIVLPVVKSAQPVQQLPSLPDDLFDEEEESGVSMHDLCEAVLEMADKRYKADEIIHLFELTEQEYREVVAYIRSHRSEFENPSVSSSAPLPSDFRSERSNFREVAQEAKGSQMETGSDADAISDLSTIRALREIGKRLKNGEDKTKIVKSFGLPYGRATQEMSAVVDMVEEQIMAEGK